MGKENFKILIRNLRTNKNEKLKIQTTASAVKFNKVSKSVRIQQKSEPDKSNGQ
jgi:hypothetical protein